MEVIMEKVSLDQKFALFNEQWKPKIVGELNGQYVKLGKIEGSLVWHQHEKGDELFLVVKGICALSFLTALWLSVKESLSLCRTASSTVL
jgi:hypothetical protein